MIISNNLVSGDVGQIVMMHGHLYATEHDFDYTFKAYVAEPLAQFVKRKNPRERIWLAKSPGELVGSICICEVSQSTAQLRWFLIHPQKRGTGLGKQLLGEALDFCRSHDYLKVTLWTIKNLDAARNLYEKNGFLLQEEISHELWGAVRTELLYEKTL